MKSMWKPVLACLVSAFLVTSLAPATATGGMMEKERTGMLAGIEGHNAAGKVAIEKHEGGNHVLTMTDINIDKVPDGRVYLGKDGDYTKGIEIGLLKKFTGTVQFPIPPGTNPDDYDSVVVWCKKFNVGIGRAYFAKEMMKEKGMMNEGGTMEKKKPM
jgi:hypothetical protein